MLPIEEWRAIPSLPGYEVSSLGQFRKGSLDIRGTAAHNGYRNIAMSVGGKQRWFLAHRLVAMTFLPNPEELPLVNHIDGDRANNAVSNLEWCSRSHNQKHAWQMKKAKVRDHDYLF